jgi:hypothetical protein
MTDGQSPNGHPPGWRFRRRPLVVAVLLDAVLAGVLLAAGSGIALRPFVVFLFLVLGPGLAITGFLRLHDPATELALAIPLSLALDVAVAAGMSLAIAWRPDLALLGLVLVVGAALALQLHRSRPVVDEQAGGGPPGRSRGRWLRLTRGDATATKTADDDDRRQ